MPIPRRTVTRRALVPLLVAALLPASAAAQSLRGSSASIDRMYEGALDAGLDFHKTSSGVRTAAKLGTFVRLEDDQSYTLARVSFPYVVETTARWVEQFAPLYRASCGERLVITSAVRPATRQPRNSVERSVHPTGMAVDLRRPRGACLRWLRSTLLDQEEAGIIEATEERHPAHFHVAVFPDAIRDRDGDDRAPTVFRATTATAASARDAEQRTITYQIRAGDTLWGIARRHGTSVAQIQTMNNLLSTVVQPGQQIQVPTAR